MNYCETFFIPRTFNFVYFVDMAMQLQILTKYLLSIILYNLKSTNSRIHEHVHHHNSIKFSAVKLNDFTVTDLYTLYTDVSYLYKKTANHNGNAMSWPSVFMFELVHRFEIIASVMEI